VLAPGLPIRTERLLLRGFRATDLDQLYDLQSRPDVTRYLPYGVRDRAEVARVLEQKAAAAVLHSAGSQLTLAVELPGSGQLIGDVILFWHSQEQRAGEIGYVFHPDHAGHGYASEAARVMLRLGFADLGLHRITGRIDARNAASARVLERLGMRREAHFRQNEFLKGEWSDEVVYAILEDEWQAAASER
jgi:RimJ/RimL family protein N-acetyltransferase